jgi:hypothetical protein
MKGISPYLAEPILGRAYTGQSLQDENSSVENTKVSEIRLDLGLFK